MIRNSLHIRNLCATLAMVAGVAVGLCVFDPATSLAQTALGTGRGLEKDLRKGGTGNTPPRDFGAEVRLRNSLVTGNSAGGRSLRIAAPYSDPADFRDSLGSTDIFAFRRDSLYSGLGGQGYRGTEGLQYQFGWSTGGSTVKGLTLTRDGASAGQVPGGLSSGNESAAPRFSTKSWEIATPVTGAMRSTAAFTSTRSLTPTAVGVRQLDTGERQLVAASSLLGLRSVALEQREPWNQNYGDVKTPPPTPIPNGQVQPKAPTATLPPNPLAAQPVGTHQETGASTQAATSTSQRTAYDDLRARLDTISKDLDKKDKPKPSEQKPGDTTIDPLKPKTYLPGSTTPGASSAPGADKPTDSTQEPSAWEQRMDSLRATLRSAELASKGDAGPATLDASTLRAIRQAGQQERTKSGVDAPLGRTNIFAEHIKAAEKYMSEERYFDAEERFTRAIAVRPGDANALAGRINAQLGSGLFVSAAVNLRTLAVTKPDAIGMLFEPSLLPSKARQEQLISQFRSNLALDNKPDIRLPKESALLLAYLGYQRSDPAIISEGLTAYESQATPEEKTLVAFLKGVWLGDEEAK